MLGLGGEVGFELRLDADSDWMPVGPWFSAFVQLSQRLHSAQLSGLALSRVLVSVPQSDMVSLGLATGFSRASYLAGQDRATEIELEDIKVGDTLQVRSAWQAPAKLIRAPEDLVGEVASIDTSRSDSVTLRLTFRTGGQKLVRILRHLCPTGQKDPGKHLRIFRVPAFAPQRPGKTKKEFPYRDLKKEETQAWLKKWEKWDYQIDPTLAIFGSPTKVNNYGSPEFIDHELHQTLLRVDSDSLMNVARVDSMDIDLKPHLINIMGQLSSFPKKGTHAFEMLQEFPFVCLDGNAAMVYLSDRPILDKKCVIGLWETSKPNLQELALTTFLEEATRFKFLANLEQLLDWKAPPGVQCWGWS
jgi:hypothetical protein